MLSINHNIYQYKILNLPEIITIFPKLVIINFLLITDIQIFFILLKLLIH